MQYLLDKKILFIAPRFFNYEIEIKSELEKQGAQVDSLPDRPYESALAKAITKHFPKIVCFFADRFYKRLLGIYGSQKYDLVFVINGQTLSRAFIHHVKKTSPKAVFIIYLWDSIANRKQVVENLNEFAQKFTFDAHDAEKYNIALRPLFYGDGFANKDDTPIKYQISFIGTAHTDRYAIVDKIKKSLGIHVKTYWYLYLQARWVFYVYRWLQPGMKFAKLDDFKFTPLAKKELQKVFSESLAILDIEHPDQNGMTMRTLETLGAQKKLVTTNKTVAQYDFYTEQNICVVDRNNPIIPSDFLETPYKKIPENIRNRYSIGGWAHEIFDSVMVAAVPNDKIQHDDLKNRDD